MIWTLNSGQLFQQQWNNRKNSDYMKQMKDLFDEIKHGTYISLAQIFDSNMYAQNYGVVFRVPELADNGCSYIYHTLSIPPREFGRYKLVILDALNDFIDNYFDKLKTDPDFNGQFLESAPNHLFNRYVVMVDTVDYRQNLIFGLLEQHPFMSNDGFNELNMTNHALDSDYMRTYCNYSPKEYDISVKHVSFDFVRWLYSTNPLFSSTRVMDFGLTGESIEQNATEGKIFVADDFRGFQNLRLLHKQDSITLPFLVSRNNGLAPLFAPVMHEAIRKIKFGATNTEAYATVKLGNNTYKQHLKAVDTLASIFHLNLDGFKNLMVKIFQAPKAYDGRNNLIVPAPNDTQYGFAVWNGNRITKEFDTIFNDMTLYRKSSSDLLYSIYHDNQSLMSDLAEFSNALKYDDDLSFSTADLPVSNFNKPLTVNKSGLETMFDLMGNGDKSLICSKRHMYALNGNSKLETVYEVKI